MKKGKKKLCFVSSSGGHWEELMCLREIADENDSFFVTEEGGQVQDAALKGTFYTIPQINRREKGFAFKFIKLFFKAFSILRKEKPDVVITTGALAAFPFCLAGKIMRKKIVYIETFARVNGKSLTGKLVYPFADLFLVQWEPMLKCYPKAKYVGGIF
ncbi:MAG: polysaccharide biosynthesis protein [Ruminococcus sp.]|nr:polysaccharide biosynthesis protein [Ruminococcus sp.]